jgi:hypothetical protein
MNSTRGKLVLSGLLILCIQCAGFAQIDHDLRAAYFYDNWYEIFYDKEFSDSLKFTLSEEAERYLLVDKILIERSGKLKSKQFAGFIFKIGQNYYVQHFLFSEYLNDLHLLVRFHVLGTYGAAFIASDDSAISLDRHNYTGLGIVGDAVADALKNKKDKSRTEWKGKDGRLYSVIFYASVLDEDGYIERVNPSSSLLSEMVIEVLIRRHGLLDKYGDKKEWTAEEIGIFLTRINELSGNSVVRFQGLDFSSTFLE